MKRLTKHIIIIAPDEETWCFAIAPLIPKTSPNWSLVADAHLIFASTALAVDRTDFLKDSGKFVEEAKSLTYE